MLQYAVDTLRFIKPKLQNIIAIKIILRGYELASIIKVNFFKGI